MKASQKAHLALVLHTLIVGPAYTFSSWASAEFDPFTVHLLRCVFTLPFFAVMFFVRGGFARFKPRGRSFWLLVLLSVQVVGINQFLYTYGLQFTSPGNSALLYATSPMLVTLLAVFLLGRERLTVGKLLGVSLALTGVLVLLVGTGKANSGHGPDPLFGNLITLVSVVNWSFYLALSGPVMRHYDMWQATAMLFGIGILLYTPLGLLLGEPLANTLQHSTRAWVGIATLVAINNIAAMLLVNFGLLHLQASQVAVYMNAQPITATLAALAFGAQPLQLAFVVGGSLAIWGIWVLNQARRQRQLWEEAQQNGTPLPRGNAWQRSLAVVLWPVGDRQR